MPRRLKESAIAAGSKAKAGAIAAGSKMKAGASAAGGALSGIGSSVGSSISIIFTEKIVNALMDLPGNAKVIGASLLPAVGAIIADPAVWPLLLIARVSYMGGRIINCMFLVWFWKHGAVVDMNSGKPISIGRLSLLMAANIATSDIGLLLIGYHAGIAIIRALTGTSIKEAYVRLLQTDPTQALNKIGRVRILNSLPY